MYVCIACVIVTFELLINVLFFTNINIHICIHTERTCGDGDRGIPQCGHINIHINTHTHIYTQRECLCGDGDSGKHQYGHINIHINTHIYIYAYTQSACVGMETVANLSMVALETAVVPIACMWEMYTTDAVAVYLMGIASLGMYVCTYVCTRTNMVIFYMNVCVYIYIYIYIFIYIHI